MMQFIKDIGKMGSRMVKVNKDRLMDLFILDNGSTAKRMARES